jgi:hypothetical protein
MGRKLEAISQIETAISLEQNTQQVETMRNELEEIRR